MEYSNLDNINNNIPYDCPNFYDSSYKPQGHKRNINNNVFRTPQKIYNYLDSLIYSHSTYKKALSLFIWKHMNGHASGALLVAGESGSGKTEMIRALTKIYSNIHIADGASVVPNGYKGNSSLATHLSSLDFQDKKFPPILVIDEFDKLCQKGTTSWSDTGLIAELLKFIEGGVYNSGTTDKPVYVDTTGLAVILLGSFSALTERNTSHPIGFNAYITDDAIVKTKLKKEQILTQLPPELQGRISQIIILESFTEDDYLCILRDKRYSPVIRLSQEYGLHMTISEEKTHEIAHDAFTSHTGVRQMNNAISAYLDEKLFTDPDIKEISIE